MKHYSLVLSALLVLSPLASIGHAAADAPALTDANIAAIVVAANNIDIKEGKLAKEKSSNTEVKNFGQMMINDHEAVNKQATDLAKKLSLTPVESDASKGLKADAEKTYKELSAKKGADFDRAYVANEVAYHEAVINTVETALIPNAKNAELKSLLEAVVPALKTHLEHAKHLQAQLK
jgi:putative membrane protein